MSAISVSGLFIYPIKSCGPVARKQARLVPGGLEFDRRYMVIDEGGRFVTARTQPSLLRVSVELEDQDGSIVARRPGSSEGLVLPLDGQWACDDSLVETRVWRDRPLARVHPSGSAWFSEYLGKPVRLVFMPPSQLRQVNRDHAQEGDVVSFADGFPLLLTSEESLAELNSGIDVELGMHRFRPNVVVRGAPAYAEDYWARLRLGEVTFDAPKLCDRCVMTTIDPVTLEKGAEPLQALALSRRWNGAVWFGSNLVPRKSGTLCIFDRVEVIESRAHPSGKL